jgi:hypothetical protein
MSVLATSACAIDGASSGESTAALSESSGLSSASSVRVAADAPSFDVDVTEAGRYTISTPGSDEPFQVTVDGQSADGPTVTLPAGHHELSVGFTHGRGSAEYIDVVYAARPPIVMGMYNNTAVPPGAEDSTAESFRTIANRWMVGSKIKVDRQFDDKIPVSYARSAGAKDPANGNVSFLSIKPTHGDVAGVAAGRYDAEIEALAATIPAGSYFTMYHEPEDNMTGAKFTAMFKHFYRVAKAANPNIQIGYVAMAYQWRPSSPTTRQPDEWWVGAPYTDFLAVDTYVSGWEGTAYTLDEDPMFQRWYKWAKPKHKPIILAEYGIESDGTHGFSDDVRATAIRKSIEWAWTQPQIKMILWWNGTSATPGGKDHFLNPTTSLPADRFPRARKAWNDAVTRFGSTGTTY